MRSYVAFTVFCALALGINASPLSLKPKDTSPVIQDREPQLSSLGLSTGLGSSSFDGGSDSVGSDVGGDSLVGTNASIGLVFTRDIGGPFGGGFGSRFGGSPSTKVKLKRGGVVPKYQARQLLFGGLDDSGPFEFDRLYKHD